MLGKLMKYEFKSTWRLYGPMFLVVLIATPILAIFTSWNQGIQAESALDVLRGLSIVGYVLLLIAVGVASYVFIIMRFFHSMTKESAYFTYMIPAKTSELILSKLLVAVVWQVASFLVISASILGFTFAHDVWKFHQVKDLFKFLKQVLEVSDADQAMIIGWSVLLIATIIVGLFTGTLMFYASIAIGQTAKNHKILLSIGCYFGFYTLVQTISSFATMPFMLFHVEDMNSLENSKALMQMEFQVFGVAFVISVICGIAYFIITKYFFQKKLNLE